MNNIKAKDGEDKGFVINELAEALDIAQSMIRGNKTGMDVHTVIEICHDALGLCEEDEKPQEIT